MEAVDPLCEMPVYRLADRAQRALLAGRPGPAARHQAPLRFGVVVCCGRVCRYLLGKRLRVSRALTAAVQDVREGSTMDVKKDVPYRRLVNAAKE